MSEQYILDHPDERSPFRLHDPVSLDDWTGREQARRLDDIVNTYIESPQMFVKYANTKLRAFSRKRREHYDRQWEPFVPIRNEKNGR